MPFALRHEPFKRAEPRRLQRALYFPAVEVRDSLVGDNRHATRSFDRKQISKPLPYTAADIDLTVARRWFERDFQPVHRGGILPQEAHKRTQIVPVNLPFSV